MSGGCGSVPDTGWLSLASSWYRLLGPWTSQTLWVLSELFDFSHLGDAFSAGSCLGSVFFSKTSAWAASTDFARCWIAKNGNSRAFRWNHVGTMLEPCWNHVGTRRPGGKKARPRGKKASPGRKKTPFFVGATIFGPGTGEKSKARQETSLGTSKFSQGHVGTMLEPCWNHVGTTALWWGAFFWISMSFLSLDLAFFLSIHLAHCPSGICHVWVPTPADSVLSTRGPSISRERPGLCQAPKVHGTDRLFRSFSIYARAKQVRIVREPCSWTKSWPPNQSSKEKCCTQACLQTRTSPYVLISVCFSDRWNHPWVLVPALGPSSTTILMLLCLLGSMHTPVRVAVPPNKSWHCVLLFLRNAHKPCLNKTHQQLVCFVCEMRLFISTEITKYKIWALCCQWNVYAGSLAGPRVI